MLHFYTGATCYVEVFQEHFVVERKKKPRNKFRLRGLLKLFATDYLPACTSGILTRCSLMNHTCNSFVRTTSLTSRSLLLCSLSAEYLPMHPPHTAALL